MLHTGDFVSSGRKDSYWQTEFFDPAQPMIEKITLFPIQGDHEAGSRYFYQYFDTPDAATGDHNENWYWFDYGNARFIGIDTETDFSSGSAQYLWLIDRLTGAKPAKTWIFVFQHYPAYSSGSHGGDPNVDNILVPLYQQYGVDLVFAGHDHIYEHAKDLSGVHYVVSGGGGAPLYSINATVDPFQLEAVSAYHHCVIDINGSNATVTPVPIDNTVTMTPFPVAARTVGSVAAR